MLSIESNNISLTRGDSAYISVPMINAQTSAAYTMASTDTLRMTVRKKASDTAVTFQKVAVGTNTFRISPSDTADLDYGKYEYDVELTTAAGDKYTVVTKHYFILTEEVTR